MTGAPNAPHKNRIKRADIIRALEATNGAVHLAARQLSCSHTTIYRRMEKDARMREVVDNARGELVDIAENGLRKRVLDGDTTAMIWITKTLGKDRGYVERQEVTGKDGGTIKIETFDYGAAVATIATGSEPDGDAPGEDQGH